MKIQSVFSVVQSEVLVCKRLARTRALSLCIFLIAAVGFLIVSVSHVRSGGLIPMLGILSPLYVAGTHGDDFFLVFCIGLLLISVDHERRDEYNRIGEVVRTRPVSNFDILLGRLIANILVIALPMLCFLLLVLSYGLIAETFSFGLGTRIEPLSVFSFVVLDIIPNFAFFGSLVILLALVLKSRLLALAITLVSLFGLFWISTRLPLDVSGPLQTITGNSILPSELAPSFLSGEIVCVRIALLLFAVGFLYIASIFLKRTSPAKSKEFVIAAVFIFIGIVLVSSLYGVQARAQKQVQQWITTHEDNFIPSAFPDVHEIRGQIILDPPHSVFLALNLDVSVEMETTYENVLFSFNPGYRITALAVAGNEIQDYKFEHGLLRIPKGYFDTEVSTLDISAEGLPDERFAYLDSVDTVSKVIGPSVTQLRFLGTKSSIFHRNFVVLPSGIKWYPTAGTATKEDQWEQRKRDFFTTDLEVTVPRHWIVAGPAKRQRVSETENSTFRFKQSNLLPEIALVGSRFEQAAVEFDGIWFEILYSKAHSKTIEAFGPADDAIKQRLESFLNELTSKGIDFPFDVISLVEVPSDFRVFGGGERMDSIMYQPGIMMVRESSLPTVPLQGLLPNSTKEEAARFNASWVDWQFNGLTFYMRLPMYQGNPLQNFYENLVSHQTNATGPSARLLNALTEQLSLHLFDHYDDQFDFHLAINPNVLDLARFDPFETFWMSNAPSRFDLAVKLHRRRQAIGDSPVVWDAIESVTLPDTELGEKFGHTMWVMRHRSAALAKLLLDELGSIAIADTLVKLNQRFIGKNFVYEDFQTILKDQGVMLEELAGDLIELQGLPGFVVSDATARPYQSEQITYYQTKFNLHNFEPTSGPVALSLIYHEARPNRKVNRLRPFLVKSNQSVQVEIVSRYPVKHVWIEPYLARNRMDLRVELPYFEHANTPFHVHRNDATINSVDQINQEVQESSSITIDDLDLGFSLDQRNDVQSAISSFGRRLFGTPEIIKDRGVPVFRQFQRQSHQYVWERKEDPTAFGVYRRTFTISRSGMGETFAEFTTKLPHLGEWRLEYFLPSGDFHEEVSFMGIKSSISNDAYFVGKIRLNLSHGDVTTPMTFDSSNRNPGWHVVGDYTLTDASVTVSVSDIAETGNIVIADAVRWTPVQNVQKLD